MRFAGQLEEVECNIVRGVLQTEYGLAVRERPHFGSVTPARRHPRTLCTPGWAYASQVRTSQGESGGSEREQGQADAQSVGYPCGSPIRFCLCRRSLIESTWVISAATGPSRPASLAQPSRLHVFSSSSREARLTHRHLAQSQRLSSPRRATGRCDNTAGWQRWLRECMARYIDGASHDSIYGHHDGPVAGAVAVLAELAPSALCSLLTSQALRACVSHGER